jgi:hypothetical protein
MPPLGCLPFTRALKAGNTGTCLDGMTALAKLHNKALPKDIQLPMGTLLLVKE